MGVVPTQPDLRGKPRPTFRRTHFLPFARASFMGVFPTQPDLVGTPRPTFRRTHFLPVKYSPRAS